MSIFDSTLTWGEFVEKHPSGTSGDVTWDKTGIYLNQYTDHPVEEVGTAVEYIPQFDTYMEIIHITSDPEKTMSEIGTLVEEIRND